MTDFFSSFGGNDATPADLLLEFTNFQSDSVLKEIFCDTPLTDFCSKYFSPQKYPKIRKHALLMPPVFGSTYHCEQFFSLMKNVKSRIRTCLTDENFQECMNITKREIQADIDGLSKQRQCQVSHW
jgi:hypothetical protein